MVIRDNAIKVYKDTAWVWLGVFFFIAMEATFIYLLFASNDIWLYVVSVVAIILIMTYFFEIKRNRNTIVVYPNSLQIEHAQKMKDTFEWEDVGTVEIQWPQIKQFSVELKRGSYYYTILVEMQEGKNYRFAVFEPTKFFLKQQLKRYHKQYK